MIMASEEVQVLLVDDDEVDVLLLREAFEANGIANPLHVARDGVEGLEMLRGDPGHPPVPRPNLILLDLNMPRMNGIEFLQELRDDPKLHDSVVFVLTTSDDERDRLAAYDHLVAGYIVKADVGDDFGHLIRLFKEFTHTVKLPTRRN